MEKQTLETYFGTIGGLLCAGAAAFEYRECPFQDALFDAVSGEGGTIQGTLQMPEALAGRFPWLGGTLSVRGTTDGPAFVLETALTGARLPAFPPVLPFQVRETRLRLSNRMLEKPPGIAAEEAAVWESELEVLWEGTMGTDVPVPAIIRFYPFRQGKLTEFYVSFGDGGTLVDAGAFMSGCLGFPADFSAMLPAGFPFVSQVKPRDFWLNVGEDGGSYSIQGFSLKLCYEDEGTLFTLAGLSFRSLYLELSYHGQSGSGASFAPAAGGTLEVGGIPLDFRFGSPYLSLTVDSRNWSGMTAVSIQTLAGNLGFSVPDFFASVLIKDVFLQAQLESGSFFSYFYFTEASEAKLGGSVSDGLSLEWKGSAVSLRVGNGRTQAGLRSVLLLKGAGETLGAFSLAGTWMPGELAFSGRWTAGKGSFNRIYEAVFSHRLPAQAPVFTVCSLELSGRAGKTAALERLRGRVKAEITDESLLGFGFSLTADLLSDESGFSCTGLVEFAHYFTLEVMAAWKKDGGFSWAFALLLENWRLAVSYDKGKGTITGRLESPCTLGDLADALLRLLDPSDSFKRSGAWSFLNSLSFTGCGVTYWEKTGRMEFSLDMGYKNAFVQISRLTAALDGNGVQFQIVGNFLGTDYTQENPLAFSPNDPPDTQGRGFSVDYLGLAKGVEPPRLTPGAPVAQNLEALKQAWNQETSLESLTLHENAGILFGLEMNLASMLKIQLLYQEAQGYCGGRFALDGPKAGALAGLSAELSYGKLQNGLGVFAGKFVPSKQMKTLSFGAVRLGLGEVEGLLYTNGDFYLDAGFPKNLDFSRSFAVSYGAFHGKGGLYVRKARQFASQTSPYSWCFQMGLGLRISLGTDYRSSMFSAGASVIMAGCFEGLYANDSYVEKMKQYYEETQRRSDSAAEEEVSMTARIFMDFFELIFRSIKAQKCHSGLCSEPFDELRLSGSQLGNIQGMVNRFLLGGRRGIYEPAGVMRGMFSMSGQQVVLNDSDRVSGYRFRVEPLTLLPEWLVCSEEKPPELAFSREEARQYFPACAYTAGIFTEGPKVAAFYTEEEMPVTLTTLMSVEQTVYCKGVPGTQKDGSCPAYGGMFWIQAAPVRRGSRVCAISEYGDTRCLPQWAEEGRAEALKLLYADREGAYHFLEAEKLFCLGSDKTGEKHMAYVGQPQLFLEMVEHTLETGEELFLSFPEEAAFLPDGDEPFKLFFAVHLKPLTAYEEFCTCIIAQKGEALELRTGDRLWRRQSGFGNLLVKCSTFMHEEDDEQSRLYAVYNNLGAELIYDGKLSHETPPYVGQEEDGRREFELFLPYGRACGMGEAPYEMVTAGKPLTIRLFWIDLLGNRMEAGRELSWTPVYTDRLTGLWEYEGISLGASYAGQGAELYLELTLHYDPDQPEEALPASKSLSWTQGLRQLSQPDVRLELRTSLQADPCTLDKEAVLTFLRACEKVPDQPGSLTLRMKLDGWKKEPGLAALWQELTVKRDKALCLEDGPSEVWTISREVALAQNADALPGAMHLYTEQERWYVLTTSADTLIENVRWTGAFGFLPFPAVSGIFQDGGREYRLNGVGLNAILDDFLSDFQMLNQPETLCRMGAQADTAPLLPTLYGLRRSVARALASRVVSFDKDAPETLLKKVRSVAEQFFYAHPDLDRKQLIFLAGSGEWSDVFPMTYRGVIGSGDGFPMGISLEEKQFSFLGAVQTGKKLPAGELPLVMRHLRPRNGAVSYTPWEMRPGTEAVCVDLPQDLCPPSSLPPDTPVLLSFTAGEAAELTFSVNPAADTEVHLRFMEKERGALRAADNSPLAAMETYRRESIALLQDLSPENLKRLTALMEDFCHSVEQFEQNTTAETGTHMWSWEKDENGNIEKLTANRQVMEDGIRFYYQTETSPGLEMEKTEDGYRFQKDYLPREGSTLILRLRFHSSRALQDGQLWTLRKSSYENPVFLLSSPKAAF